jgi:hypothetical protein
VTAGRCHKKGTDGIKKAPTVIDRRLSLHNLIYIKKLRASSPKSKGGVASTAFATRVGAVSPLRPAF